jgi:hypothetical protein
MKPSFFQPRQFVIPPALVLVPYFSQGSLFSALKKQALRRQDILHSTLLWFENMAIVSGFIGYPHLFTLLPMIADLGEKEIYFLGSAGAIDPRFTEPEAVQVERISPSAIFKRFSGKTGLALKAFPGGPFRGASGVSVDIIQRETPAWLAAQRARKTGIVEMELFPLRWYLQRPFQALVVLSDRVDATGIRPFADKKKFQSEFARAFDFIAGHINHVQIG